MQPLNKVILLESHMLQISLLNKTAYRMLHVLFCQLFFVFVTLVKIEVHTCSSYGLYT